MNENDSPEQTHEAASAPRMNYQCVPDLNPEQDLTVDAVSRFQRFRQAEDVATVDALLDQEFARHIKLCELAILQAAKSDIYGCDLPRHPLDGFDLWASDHLKKMGSQVEYTCTACEETAPSEYDRAKTLRATVVRSRFVAKWFLAKPLQPEVEAAEWQRRVELEDKDLIANPPHRQSSGSGATDDEIECGDAVWATVLDGKYVVEIQRINHRNYLCLFEIGGRLLHVEPTNVAFGAMFGPDVGDVAKWEERAVEIVDGWRAGGTSS
jgi:hypothetical protein